MTITITSTITITRSIGLTTPNRQFSVDNIDV